MSTIVSIRHLTLDERQALKALYSRCIPLAFEAQGLSSWSKAIEEEIAHKHSMIDQACEEDSSLCFFVAKIGSKIVGAISYGPCGQEILDCTRGSWSSLIEIGSLYVLPEHQGQGIASALIHKAVSHLNEKGEKEFCLDSGYHQAQILWRHKFGAPTIIAKDYWGKNSDHHLWRCTIQT